MGRNFAPEVHPVAVSVLFSQIPGLSALKNTLVEAVRSGQIAHAQLFQGPAGSGNLAMALAYATYLNCEAPAAHDACGNCASCQKMSKLAHPDVHHVFPVAVTKQIKEAESDAYMPLWREFVASQPYGTLSDWLTFIGIEGNRQGNISAEEARNVIKKLSLTAYEGGYKVLLLWQPEMLNQHSANALLKVLEEPPAKTVFLLISNDADRLLTTILSRTQRISIPAFSEQELSQFLVENTHTDPARAAEVAWLAEGSLGRALALAQAETDDRHTWFSDWMRACYRGVGGFATLVKTADSFDTQPREFQKSLMEYGLRLFREVFLYQQGVETLSRLEGQAATFVQNFAKVIPEKNIEPIVNAFSEGHFHLERNVRAKFILMDLSLQLARLFSRT